MAMLLRAIGVGVCAGVVTVAGIEDISALAEVTERLETAGCSDVDPEKIWRGNVPRVLSAGCQGTR